MQIATGNRGPGSWLADRMHPKLLAIKVSGCHPIPVIVRTSSRDPQEGRSITQTDIAGAARS
jgi:hypothetical protein